jgi:HD-GYP domain-containing protein (c-di-GMP phosphodiesterase class II)
MRLTYCEKLAVGMKLGQPVYGAAGQLLLAPGAALTARYITLLAEMGVPAVYVADPDTSDLSPPQYIHPQTRTAAWRSLTSISECLAPAAADLRKQSLVLAHEHSGSERFAQAVRSTFRGADLETLGKSVDAVMADLLDQNVLVGLNTIKTHDAYTFQHSIDVTIMGVVLARKLGWPASRVRMFGIGSMLHDIGKIMVAADILKKPGRLTENEFADMKAHPERGYHILRAIRPTLGAVIPQAAYQHHERQDGSGYPRGLKGTNTLGDHEPGTIHDFGAVCAVADVYDAMSSTRPYRKGWAPDRVVTTIAGMAGAHLNRAAVNAFLSIVAPFPVCSEVTFVRGKHAGCRGIVTSVPKEDRARPIVRILEGPGRARVEAFEVDLRTDPDSRVRSAESDEIRTESMGSRRQILQPPAPLPPEVVASLRQLHQARA